MSDEYLIKMSDVGWLQSLFDSLNNGGIWISDFHIVKKTGKKQLTVTDIFHKENYAIFCRVAKIAGIELKNE